jgi:hypothetical protein
LYHVQAVKWINEYGSVPGLGNLHHRWRLILLGSTLAPSLTF